MRHTPRHAAPADPPPRWWPPLFAAGLAGTLALAMLLAAGLLYGTGLGLAWLDAR